MADGIEADTSRPKLEYPYPEPPPRGQSLEVAPGVRWIRMPLPWLQARGLDDGGLLPPTARAEEVPVADWIALARRVSGAG